jgi:hypothetical protein
MRKCHRTRFRKGQVDGHVDEHGSASLLGLASCNRRTCEFCGPRLLARDAELVEAGVTRHGFERTLMLSLTVRHWPGLRLRVLRDGLVDSWGALQRHRAFKDLLAPYGAQVFVRVVEVTHGENGWHPHYHVLLFLDRDVAELPRGELARIERALAEQWRAAVERTMGRAHRPTLSSGVKLTACHRADYVTKLGLAEYLTKLGLNDTGASEAERGKGITFWGLTRRWIANGCDVDDADAALVREFIEAMRGRVVVAWPRTGEYTRKRVEALRPEALPAVRETFALFAEEYDAIRDRTLDGVDARVALLRAAEAAQPGQVQQAVEATVCELLKRGRARVRVHVHPAPPS